MDADRTGIGDRLRDCLACSASVMRIPAWKAALLALCMLAGAVCAVRGEELEQAGILTREWGLRLAIGAIIGGVVWLGILYEIKKRK